MYFADAASCHAAMRAGRSELKWSHRRITDQDAEWIGSALADPAVRVFPTHFILTDIAVRHWQTGTSAHAVVHASASLGHVPFHSRRGLTDTSRVNTSSSTGSVTSTSAGIFGTTCPARQCRPS